LDRSREERARGVGNGKRCRFIKKKESAMQGKGKR